MVRLRHLSIGGFCGEHSVASLEHYANTAVTPDLDDVLTMAKKGGQNADEFGGFCQKHLCMESWDFIVDVVHYETTVSVPCQKLHCLLFFIE